MDIPLVNKFAAHAIVLMISACLVVDPVSAAVWAHPALRMSSPSSNTIRIQSEAITPALLVEPGSSMATEQSAELQRDIAASQKPARDTKSVAEVLYRRLHDSEGSFFSVVYPLYMSRKLTRYDVRKMVRLGLMETHGNYKVVTRLFNIDLRDYKKFLNFLRKHDLQLPFRVYRVADTSTLDSSVDTRFTADNLYASLVNQRVTFEFVVFLYLAREITRFDVRKIVRLGLTETRGNYKSVTRLFNIDPRDYKKFLNFLRVHDLQLPFREFRKVPNIAA